MVLKKTLPRTMALIKGRQNGLERRKKETIEMVAISSVVPLIPNINVGENERLSFHTVSEAGGIRL